MNKLKETFSPQRFYEKYFQNIDIKINKNQKNFKANLAEIILNRKDF